MVGALGCFIAVTASSFITYFNKFSFVSCGEIIIMYVKKRAVSSKKVRIVEMGE